MRSIVLFPAASATLLLLACNGATDGSKAAPAGSPDPTQNAPAAEQDRPAPQGIVSLDPQGSGPRYPGKGFRVHEWGTHTIVLGTDGSMQRGLHHEEEDLPSFVYDRTKQELVTAVDVKMETPVLYFHSDKPLTARVGVQFPKGVLTQWYPGVTTFSPAVHPGGDPAFDRDYPFTVEACRARYQPLQNGLLMWNTTDILPRTEAIAPPAAELDRYTWSHSRAVEANPLRVSNIFHGLQMVAPQEERFLFYRGLGNFTFPVTIRSTSKAGIRLDNADANNAVGAVFVLNVQKDAADFTAYPAGVPAGGALDGSWPTARSTHAAYAQSLADALVSELDKRGLYHDESVAMVNTWARQWFLTPGVRVLYLAPQAWTDEQIPLTIDPRPEELVRQMVIRNEIITWEQENDDLVALRRIDTPEGLQHFQALGRFAEPRLRRAIASYGSTPVAAAAYLSKLEAVPVTARMGE